MRYSLLLTGIGNPRAKTIVAHNLAGHRHVSLNYAQSLLENFPIVYQTDLLRDEAEVALRQLQKIGVKASIIPMDSHNAPLQDRETAEPDEPAAAAKQEAPPAPEKHRAKAFIYKNDNHINGNRSVFGWKGGPSEKRGVQTAIVAIIIIAILGFISLLGYRGLPLHGKRPHITALDSERGADTARLSGLFFNDSGELSRTGRVFPRVSIADKLKAQEYVDSGKASVGADGAIIFYKMAIGINKYNMDAWYGLLEVYSRAQRDDDVQKTREAMEAIFGREIFSLSAIVKRFGDVINAFQTADGTYHIEYRSRESEAGEALLRETFLLAKAVGSQMADTVLSLYAHPAKKARSVLVYLHTRPFPESYAQYRSRAKIRFLD